MFRMFNIFTSSKTSSTSRIYSWMKTRRDEKDERNFCFLLPYQPMLFFLLSFALFRLHLHTLISCWLSSSNFVSRNKKKNEKLKIQKKHFLLWHFLSYFAANISINYKCMTVFVHVDNNPKINAYKQRIFHLLKFIQKLKIQSRQLVDCNNKTGAINLPENWAKSKAQNKWKRARKRWVRSVYFWRHHCCYNCNEQNL